MQNKKEYFQEIDGLRAFAVLSVIFFHSFPGYFRGGFVGVDIFYVISGFLISRHIFEELKLKQFNFIEFFKRRIKRIFPSLIIVILFSIIFGWFVLLADEFNQLGKHIGASSIFILNIFLANETGYFDYLAEFKPLLHLWSLSVEEQFYIFWPFLLWIAVQKKFNLLRITLIIFFISFFFSLSLSHFSSLDIFFWSSTRFWELMSGGILAWISLNNVKLLHFKQNFLINILFLISFVILLSSIFFINRSLPFPSIWTILPIVATLLAISYSSKSFIGRFIFMNPISIWFGTISYPLYLWHWPILSYLNIYNDGTPQRSERILAIIVSIFFAWLTYLFIEKPIRFSKNREKLKVLILIMMMMIIGLLGLTTYINDYSQTKNVQNVKLRKNIEHRIGSSSRWYEGKEGWLFLGNAYEKTVEKLKYSIKPKFSSINEFKSIILDFINESHKSKTKIVLLIGPNKSSIYPEYLPDNLISSKKRYFSFFSEELKKIPNLIFYDPTEILLKSKKKNETYYYKTDTHWNSKGAYVAFNSLLDKLNEPKMNVTFNLGKPYIGDLAEMSNLEKFNLNTERKWETYFDHKFTLTKKNVSKINLSKISWKHEIFLNNNPTSNKQVVWVIGDSFTEALMQYFNAAFGKTYYLGNWNYNLKKTLKAFKEVNEKPDLIIIVRVERSF